jgi:hypothetical protein
MMDRTRRPVLTMVDPASGISLMLVESAGCRRWEPVTSVDEHGTPHCDAEEGALDVKYLLSGCVLICPKD